MISDRSDSASRRAVTPVNWAARQRVATQGQNSTLRAVAAYADRAGVCWPGQQALAADTLQGERTVRRHLAWLEAHGLIGREARGDGRGGRTSDKITLCLDVTLARPCAPGCDRCAEAPAGRGVARPTGHRTGGLTGHALAGKSEGVTGHRAQDYRPPEVVVTGHALAGEGSEEPKKGQVGRARAREDRPTLHLEDAQKP